MFRNVEVSESVIIFMKDFIIVSIISFAFFIGNISIRVQGLY